MKHLDARVGDIVTETVKGEDAPEMRIFGATGDHGILYCEWKGDEGRQEKTFTPEELTLISKRSEPEIQEQTS